jgi:acetylornithine deacetylase
MHQSEKRVLDAIDLDGMLSYLCDLVAIPSLSGEETRAQESVATQMERFGLDVDVWELDFEALSRHPAYSAEVDRKQGLGVAGRVGQGNGPSLIFNGHVDVVPAGDRANWHFPPWRGTVTGDRVYGRGAVDMKGGLCCALFAAKAIRDAGLQLKGRLTIQSVIGEEDGGCGTLAAVLRGHTADAAVVIEPTQLAVAPAQAGALNFRITVPGYAAHGCIREEGVSAIEKFIPLYQAVMAFERDRNSEVNDPLFASYQIPYPITVGTLQAGNWASTVAESLTFEGRFGIGVGEGLIEARDLFEQNVARAAEVDDWLREHPPVIEWWGGQFAPASIPADHPVVTTVSGAFQEVSGRQAQIQGMTYGADMRLLVNQGGVATVLFGPGDVRRAHQPDEYVPIDDLVITVRTLALTALRFCGYKEED